MFWRQRNNNDIPSIEIPRYRGIPRCSAKVSTLISQKSPRWLIVWITGNQWQRKAGSLAMRQFAILQHILYNTVICVIAVFFRCRFTAPSAINSVTNDAWNISVTDFMLFVPIYLGRVKIATTAGIGAWAALFNLRHNCRENRANMNLWGPRFTEKHLGKIFENHTALRVRFRAKLTS